MVQFALLIAAGALCAAQRPPKGHKDRCGGDTGLGCSVGEICSTKPGDCGGEGKCTRIPKGPCRPDKPVCGCNGVTYASSCAATKAGTTVSTFSSCSGAPFMETVVPTQIVVPRAVPSRIAPIARQKCGGRLPACGSDQYCLKTCTSDYGECADVPEYCPSGVFEPVCGCDGYTYQTVCHAALARRPVASRGVCEDVPFAPPPPTPSSPDCEVGTTSCSDPRAFCVSPVGKCPSFWTSLFGLRGTCRTLSSDCTVRPSDGLSGTVCGCDGVDYPNSCDAYAAGTHVRSSGYCDAREPTPATPTPTPLYPRDTDAECEQTTDCYWWGPGYYCHRANGNCDSVGHCRTVTWAEPNCGGSDNGTVCGCDGATYASACDAAAAGVSVDEEGECEPIGEPTVEVNDGSCDDDTDCKSGDFCNLDEALCGNDAGVLGVCTTKPEFCPIPFFAAMKPVAESLRSIFPVGPPSHWGGWGGSWLSVCGCDGITYESTCDAHKLGVSVRSSGACDDDIFDLQNKGAAKKR